MAVTVQFVDYLDSAATVRLDLSADPYMVGAEVDLSPPPLRRAWRSSSMTDGATLSESAFENRTVVLPVEIQASSTATARAAAQALYRELARDTNWLRVTIDGTAFYFQTYRAPDSVLEVVAGRLEYGVHTLTIPAAPFAYGTRQALPAKTVATSTTGVWASYTDTILGDVPTPPLVTITGLSLTPWVMAGSGGRFFTRESTSYALFNSTTDVVTSDAAIMATTGYIRTSFSEGNGQYLKRLTYSQSAQGANQTYRMFARVRRSSAASEFRIGTSATTYTTWAAGTTTTGMLDLGLIGWPPRELPPMRGMDDDTFYTGERFSIYASRVSGAATLDFDVFFLLTADGDGLIMGNAPANSLMIDGVHQSAYDYILDTGEERITDVDMSPIGSVPMLNPADTTQFLYFLEGIGGAVNHLKTFSATVNVRYWPRYLSVA